MVKKVILTGLAAVLAAGFLFGHDACSYVRTTAGQVRQSVKDNVPVTFEIERARKMISELEPDIRRNMHLIAKEEVEVDRIRRRADKLETKQENAKVELQRMKADLESDNTFLVYSGRRYSKNQVRVDLASRLTRAKTNDETLVSLTKVLNAREKGLAAARAKLEEMLGKKRTFQVEIENLEARQKMVEVAQAASDFSFDDSRLSRTKELMVDIETRLEVAERMVDQDGDFAGEIQLEETNEDVGFDVLEDVAQYLGESSLEKIDAEIDSQIALLIGE